MQNKELEEAVNLLKKFKNEMDKVFEVYTNNNKIGDSIETVLKELKRLQEENTEYGKQLDLDYVRENYILKDKIREILENKEIEE